MPTHDLEKVAVLCQHDCRCRPRAIEDDEILRIAEPEVADGLRIDPSASRNHTTNLRESSASIQTAPIA